MMDLILKALLEIALCGLGLWVARSFFLKCSCEDKNHPGRIDFLEAGQRELWNQLAELRGEIMQIAVDEIRRKQPATSKKSESSSKARSKKNKNSEDKNK